MTKKKMTLVIHPDDRSTDFLSPIYSTIVNKTVVRGGISKYEVIKLIEKHDRIMMMGHGCPDGLFNVGGFTFAGGLIIDWSMVPLLQTKKNSVFIWCNAERFVERYKLDGFYSGMFVSEVGEAGYCGVFHHKDMSRSYNRSVKNDNKVVPDNRQQVVDESNNAFSIIVSKHINKPTKVMYQNVMREYGSLCDTNPVASYNHKRLYLSGTHTSGLNDGKIQTEKAIIVY